MDLHIKLDFSGVGVEILIKDSIAVMMSFLSMGKKKIPRMKINQETIEIAVEVQKR